VSPPDAPLPPPVRRLGWLHFWNDFTLDFVSPLLPAGVGAAWLGIMEGAADALGQLLRVFTGRASDRSGRRVPWIRAGYGLNAAARPLIAAGLAAAWPLWIVGCRVLDRLGKGLRGSAADALVADWTSGPVRTTAYARMRVMDHLGAALGAGAAALVTWAFPDRLPLAVGLLAVPALLQLVLVAGLRDAAAAPRAPASAGWWPADRAVRWDVAVLGLAAAARLSPLLILAMLAVVPKRGTEAWPTWKLCLAWAGIGIAQAWVAALAGRAAARWGNRSAIVGTWLLTAGAYAAMLLLPGPAGVATALAAATLTAAAEGAEKALVAQRVEPTERATAFGFYTLLAALAGLAGNAAFGVTLAGGRIPEGLRLWPAAAAVGFALLILRAGRAR
jgi:MFS family permease